MLYQDVRHTEALTEQVFGAYTGERPLSLNLYLNGTNFQIKVWEALLRIPPGAVTSYQGLAEQAGHPGASRAVGTALGRNPIAILIPCHRVIRKLGEFGNYRYGVTRKKALLGWEAATLVQQTENYTLPLS